MHTEASSTLPRDRAVNGSPASGDVADVNGMTRTDCPGSLSSPGSRESCSSKAASSRCDSAPFQSKSRLDERLQNLARGQQIGLSGTQRRLVYVPSPAARQPSLQ